VEDQLIQFIFDYELHQLIFIPIHLHSLRTRRIIHISLFSCTPLSFFWFADGCAAPGFGRLNQLRLDLAALAATQRTCPIVASLHSSSSLSLQAYLAGGGHVLCDVS